MIDSFSILLSHALVFITCWRLLSRHDLDHEPHATPLPQQDSASTDA